MLIRLKSDIPLKRAARSLPDGSYIAQISGDGATVTVRVIEYFVDVEGQDVPEMFCLITDLMGIAQYPARELAGLYKRRWDGSETALREAKASLNGAGPGTGPMLRSGTPDLIRQELAAWAAATEMTRGVARAAVPARKGRRAGQPVRPREICHAPRPPRDPGCNPFREDLLQGADRRNREIPHHHRPEPAPPPQIKIPQQLRPRHHQGHRHPHRRSPHHHGQRASLTSTNT